MYEKNLRMKNMAIPLIMNKQHNVFNIHKNNTGQILRNIQKILFLKIESRTLYAY